MDQQQIITQNFISYIKNISLHLENLFAPTQIDLKSITTKTFKLITEFQKFVSQYNLKVLKEIESAKITVPLMFYRAIKDKINDPDFMRYKHKDYELKFVFIRINLECHVHVQILKNTSGIRKSSIAFQKLQRAFIYLLHNKITNPKFSQQVSIKFFEQNAKSFLQQVYQIMNGEIVCYRCRKSMIYQNELRIILPPTVRLENYRDKKEFEDHNLPVKYIHQSCI